MKKSRVPWPVVQPNPPARPVEGQLWYDNTDGVDQYKIYDGTTWSAAGGLNPPVVKRLRKVVPVTDELYQWIKHSTKQS